MPSGVKKTCQHDQANTPLHSHRRPALASSTPGDFVGTSITTTACFRTSAESLATAEEAHESGMMELEHVEATAWIAKGPA